MPDQESRHSTTSGETNINLQFIHIWFSTTWSFAHMCPENRKWAKLSHYLAQFDFNAQFWALLDHHIQQFIKRPVCFISTQRFAWQLHYRWSKTMEHFQYSSYSFRRYSISNAKSFGLAVILETFACTAHSMLLSSRVITNIGEISNDQLTTTCSTPYQIKDYDNYWRFKPIRGNSSLQVVVEKIITLPSKN
jgi:hypothetical protein